MYYVLNLIKFSAQMNLCITVLDTGKVGDFCQSGKVGTMYNHLSVQSMKLHHNVSPMKQLKLKRVDLQTCKQFHHATSETGFQNWMVAL